MYEFSFDYIELLIKGFEVMNCHLSKMYYKLGDSIETKTNKRQRKDPNDQKNKAGINRSKRKTYRKNNNKIQKKMLIKERKKKDKKDK